MKTFQKEWALSHTGWKLPGHKEISNEPHFKTFKRMQKHYDKSLI